MSHSTPIAIIAIHGNGGGGFRFERIKPFFPSHIEFEAITLPGFASRPSDPTLSTVSAYADEIIRSSQILQAKNDNRPIILLGTGIGGTFALDFAQRHQSISGIILHAPVGTRLDSRFFPRLMRTPGMAALGKWLFSSRLTRPIFNRLLFIDYRQIPADYLTQFFDEYRHCQVFAQMFDIIDRDWWESLKPIQLPAALLWGERERVLSVDQLNDYKKLLPNYIVRTVPEWDHFPMIEQPQAYADEIINLSIQLAAKHGG